MKKFLSELFSFLLILLFAYAALTKLFQFSKFKTQLAWSPLVHAHPALVAVLIPAAELLAVLLLALQSTRRTGFLLSLFLMASFTFYIIYMLAYADHLPCSCGGVLQQMTWKQHLLFNIFFTGLALAGILTNPKNKRLAVQQGGRAASMVS